MKLVVALDQPEAGLVSLVGGKGCNLHALTAAGFPVPPGFAVTAVAYEQFLASIDFLNDELGRLDYEHPDRLRDQCTALRDRLGHVPFPPAIADAVRAALARMGASEGDAFAVRSSSTFEDLAQAAFAGQHDTYLNIRGLDAIVGAVRRCFISLWSDRAVLYRQRQGFSQRDARMAVVVQRQIACDVAGVGFSIDPVSGRLDRLVVDANYGLGESVVSGEGEVDHFQLDKATLEVVDRSIGCKEHMIVATPRGTETQSVPTEMANRPCLSDAQLAQVAQLLKRVEAHYGWPQDIEWGWHGETLYQFQSRPVTTIQPRWTRDESAERFPRPMTPLTWDFIRVAFKRSLSHSLALMGLPPLAGDWFQMFDHYIYGDQNEVELLASYRPLRARSVPELVAEIPDLRRRFSWVLDLPVHWARDLDRYLIELGKASAVPLEDKSLPELWQHITGVLDVAAEYFLPNIAISITQSFLHRMLHGLVGMAVGPDRTLAVVDGLLAGCETKTAVVNREIHELAQIARQSPALARELADGAGRAFWERDRLARYPDFASRFRRFIEDHGHRELDIDYFVPCWCDQPWAVLDSIALILRGATEEDPADTARRLRVRYAETELQFLSGVPEPLRFFFRELIRLTRTYTTLDDLEHYQTTRINPIARRLGIALGQRLRQLGVIDAPEDVFFFRKEDLERLVAEYPRVNRDGYRSKVLEAKKSYEAALATTPPWSLGAASGGAAEAADSSATRRGLPGSPGSATGPCFLVHSPDDFGRFPKGAILVARTTNPAWTSLFYSASGLITESGGPLSHGAVTAREMHLPAVMSVRGAMSLFRNEQVVTVDGTQGIVRM
jgi:phosphohistidine swiveling domain-containing protein